ncbi:MAG: hypothetical protein PF505_10160 [Vallitaleaceae bacterium]|jgi:hypothetical protein|nr:hypothetical protein [Vallitaleaceae bacterium]
MIESVKISKWNLGLGVKLQYDLKDGSTFIIKASKKVIGLKEQKNHLEAIAKLETSMKQ